MTDPPTPFTAEEIKQGCPPGRAMTVRMFGDHGEETFWKTTFVECDAEGATIENQAVSSDGRPEGEPSRGRSTWEELRLHASFPEATVTEETIESPLGNLDTKRYEVPVDRGARVLWFAAALPGMPVRTAVLEDNEERLTSEIVSDTRSDRPRGAGLRDVW